MKKKWSNCRYLYAFHSIETHFTRRSWGALRTIDKIMNENNNDFRFFYKSYHNQGKSAAFVITPANG